MKTLAEINTQLVKPMESVQGTMVSEKDQSGGKSIVFDDVNPSELLTENHKLSTIRQLNDMSDGASNFLKRAFPLSTFTWSNATAGMFLNLDPWSYLATNVAVRDKIKNFSMVKGKLHLRFITNGTPFHFGRILVSYVPFYPIASANFRLKYNQLVPNFQVQNVEINPTTSIPTEMILEMYTDVDAIPLQGQTLTSLTDMGRLLFSVLTPLGSANSASPDPVTVQIYAWWEEPALGAPTPYSDVLQVGDEMTSTGPISKISTAIATGASYFKNIPIIGRFATATEIGAKAAGSIATLFGMSNPVRIPPGDSYKEVATSNFCQVAGRDNSKVFTLDSLRQTTIDPKAYGFPPRDEMSFAYLYKIPQYLRPISWDTTQAPGTLLALVGVSPCTTWQTVPAAGEVDHYMAPIGLMAHTSGNWTGSLKFRFKVVCSAYHKGRLLFRYHPFRTTAAITGFAEATSQQVIFDIGIDSEKELEIGWSRPQMWLTTGNANAPKDSNLNSNTANGGLVASCPDYCNGEISVEVLTELTAPSTPSTIQIHVFVQGTESLKFCDWTNAAFSTASTVIMQVGDEPELAMGEVKSTKLGTYDSTPDELLKVTVGEEIASLRALLRRPSVYGYNYMNTAGAFDRLKIMNFGFYYANNVFDYSPSATYATYPVQSNIQIWKNCYVAIKGTVRYKIIRINKSPANIRILQTQLVKLNRWTSTPILEDIGSVTGPSTSMLQQINLKSNGYAYLDPRESFVEFEVPDLSTKKFRITTDSSVRDAVILVDSLTGWTNTAVANAAELMYEVSISSGEDFNLMYFTGVPIMKVVNPGWFSNNNYQNRNT